MNMGWHCGVPHFVASFQGAEEQPGRGGNGDTGVSAVEREGLTDGSQGTLPAFCGEHGESQNCGSPQVQPEMLVGSGHVLEQARGESSNSHLHRSVCFVKF